MVFKVLSNPNHSMKLEEVCNRGVGSLVVFSPNTDGSLILSPFPLCISPDTSAPSVSDEAGVAMEACISSPLKLTPLELPCTALHKPTTSTTQKQACPHIAPPAPSTELPEKEPQPRWQDSRARSCDVKEHRCSPLSPFSLLGASLTPSPFPHQHTQDLLLWGCAQEPAPDQFQSGIFGAACVPQLMLSVHISTAS